MTNTPELPDKLLDLLEDVSNGQITGLQQVIAAELLDEYTPQPATLADLGEIRWTRCVKWEDDERAFTEHDYPDGGWPAIKDAPGAFPWPEIEGIDPGPLLNDGWIWQRWEDVPNGWWVHQSEPNAPFRRSGGNGVQKHAMPDLTVLCRPPSVSKDIP